MMKHAIIQSNLYRANLGTSLPLFGWLDKTAVVGRAYLCTDPASLRSRPKEISLRLRVKRDQLRAMSIQLEIIMAALLCFCINITEVFVRRRPIQMQTRLATLVTGRTSYIVASKVQSL